MRVRTARIQVALVAVVVVYLHFAAGPAWGIVFCNGQDPNDHRVTPPSNYDGVAFISSGEGASSVLINPWYIITAEHAAFNWSGSTAKFYLSGGTQTFTMMEKFTCPNSVDLAVIRLNRNTGLTGYPLYDPNVYGSEVGQGGTLVGYGMSGTSETVQAGGDPNYPRGTLRLGYNVIDAKTYVPSRGTCLRMTFDRPPGGLGSTKEAMVAVGDSGAPILINAGGSLRVAGITSAISYYDANHWPKYYVGYGDLGYGVRVADYAYASWINSKIPALPAPQTGDFNNDGNGVPNAADIDALFTKYGGIDMWYDMTGDGNVNRADSNYLIRTTLLTEYGDTNLDHLVDLADYNAMASHYGQTGTAGWALGDFNGDKNVNFADYQTLEAYFGFGTGGGLSLPPVPIPEPATLGLLACGAGLLVRRRLLRKA